MWLIFILFLLAVFCLTNTDEELKGYGHAILFPYSSESERQMDKPSRASTCARTARAGSSKAAAALCSSAAWRTYARRSSGMAGRDQAQQLGQKAFELTDLNGFEIEFCE
jgi:hypothetical protein